MSKLCLYFWYNVFKLNWYDLEVWFGHGRYVACVNSVGVCISRSGEPGLPRRDYRRLKYCFCSSVSLRRRNLVLSDKPTRLAERVSFKRESANVWRLCLGLSLRREALFWAKEYLAQVRVPRLSKNPKKVLLFWLTRRLDKSLDFWAKGGLAQAIEARLSESSRLFCVRHSQAR